jgi:Acyl-coenzyme A:6-aminopenicillanic acid acyl-transferase
VRAAGLLICAVLTAGCGTTAGAVPVPLRQVDTFPLYELTDSLPTPKVLTRQPPPQYGYACTVFFGNGRRPVVGRNFDFHDEPALILHHRPPGHFRSVSMVDISYLGFDRRHLSRLDVPRERARLREASLLPFDGMNEKGLVVAMAAVPTARAPHRGYGARSLGVIRMALDDAENVPEALHIFAMTEVDFRGGPPLHYLLADAAGRSAVVEYVAGHVRVVDRGRRPYQAMTNFVLSTSTPAQRAHDRRYHTAMTALRASGGRLTPASTLNLLRRTRQANTRWSVAYDLRDRTLRVVMGQRYGRVLTFGVG